MDEKGLEGLPLKLLITAMVIGLSAQPIYGSISYLNYNSNLGVAMQEAEAIKKAALSAFAGGPGNVRKVAVHLGDGSNPFSIRLGGAENESKSRTIDVLWHGEIAANVLFDGQGLSIVCLDGNELLIENSQELLLTCSVGRSGDIIVAEVL